MSSGRELSPCDTGPFRPDDDAAAACALPLAPVLAGHIARLGGGAGEASVGRQGAGCRDGCALCGVEADSLPLGHLEGVGSRSRDAQTM